MTKKVSEKSLIALSDAFPKDSLGNVYPFQHVIDELHANLQDIKSGTYNGMDIKKPSDTAHYLTDAIQPVLKASPALLNCVTEHGGYTKALDIPSAHRASFANATSLNLVEMDEQIVTAMNAWMGSVEEILTVEDYPPLYETIAAMRVQTPPLLKRASDLAKLEVNGYTTLEC